MRIAMVLALIAVALSAGVAHGGSLVPLTGRDGTGVEKRRQQWLQAHGWERSVGPPSQGGFADGSTLDELSELRQTAAKAGATFALAHLGTAGNERGPDLRSALRDCEQLVRNMTNAELVVPLLRRQPSSTRQFRDLTKFASVTRAGCKSAANLEIGRLYERGLTAGRQ